MLDLTRRSLPPLPPCPIGPATPTDPPSRRICPVTCRVAASGPGAVAGVQLHSAPRALPGAWQRTKKKAVQYEDDIDGTDADAIMD